MRPNIEITHALNGRVKDYAAENGMTTAEAYREIIEAGLAVVTTDAAHETAESQGGHGETGGQNGSETPDRIRDAVERNEKLPQKFSVDDVAPVVATVEQYLQSHGTATMREIVGACMAKHSLGYDVPEVTEGKRIRIAWWRNVVKPSLEQLESIEKPSGNDNDWRYVGE